jgi:VWFA-related protein
MAAGQDTAGLRAGGAGSFSRLLLFLGTAGLAGVQLAADFSQAGAPARQRLVTGIDVVSVDVSVLDRRRQPVGDLQAADFMVLENGKPQKIEYFQHIELPDPPPTAASWVKDVAADVARNDMLRERRLVVLLMDDAMMPFDGQMVASAKQIGRGVVERLGPGDLAAVVFTRDNRGAQNFTSDKARLLAAIDTFEASGYSPPALEDLAVQSAQVLYRLSEALARVPDRRKAVVHVSIGIPLEIDTHEAPGDTSYLTWLAKRTMGIAQRGNVNIYTADPGGLDGVRFYMLLRNRRTESFIIERIEDSANRFRDFLKAIADQTGGHAFINTNEFTSRIEQMFRETGSFYLLGYRPQDQRTDGRFRRLQVQVNRRDVTVRARSGYYAPSSRDTRITLPEFPADDLLAGLVPKSDVPLELAAAAFAVPGQPEAAVVLTLGARAPRSQTAPSGTGERVDVLFAAFTPEGDPRGSLRLTADLTLAPGGDGALAYEVEI